MRRFLVAIIVLLFSAWLPGVAQDGELSLERKEQLVKLERILTGLQQGRNAVQQINTEAESHLQKNLAKSLIKLGADTADVLGWSDIGGPILTKLSNIVFDEETYWGYATQRKEYATGLGSDAADRLKNLSSMYQSLQTILSCKDLKRFDSDQQPFKFTQSWWGQPDDKDDSWLQRLYRRLNVIKNLSERIVQRTDKEIRLVEAEIAMLRNVRTEGLTGEASGPSQSQVGATSKHSVTVTGGIPPYTFDWFLDGHRLDRHKPNLNVTWKRSRTSDLEIRVTDQAGAMLVLHQAVAIQSDRLNASAEGPLQATVGQVSRYEAKVDGGTPPYSYRWYIGGQLQEGVESPAMRVTWDKPGSGELLLIVSDAQGNTDRAASTITVTDGGAVTPPPVAQDPAPTQPRSKPPRSKKTGVWSLVDTRNYSGETSSASQSNGRFQWLNAYAMEGSWTPPPQTLKPGETLTFRVAVSMITQGQHGQYVYGYSKITQDNVGVEPLTGNSPVVIAEAKLDYSKGQLQGSQSGNYTVPNGSPGDRFQINCYVSDGQGPATRAGFGFIFEYR